MVHFGVLGSGSGGNSALVRSASTSILIDAGLSARQLHLRLEMLGSAAAELDAIILTHEHGDHVGGLDVFCRKVDVPVYCNALTREVLVSGPLKRPKQWRLVETGSAFPVGDLAVRTFPVAHDATDPVGMTIDHGPSGVRIGILSDVGHVTHLMREQVRDVDLLFVEANYDEVMLQNDTRRPWSTKQRIVSRHGHLSNEQAAGLACEVAGERTREIVLGHLSRDCNTPELAVETVEEALARAGRGDILVACARQQVPYGLRTLEPRAQTSVPRARDTATPTPAGSEQQAELFPGW